MKRKLTDEEKQKIIEERRLLGVDESRWESGLDADFLIGPDGATEAEDSAEEFDAIMDELKREHYEDILRLNRNVKLSQMKYDIAKGEAKARKEELECLSMELSNLIADGPQKPDPQKELPFSDSTDESDTHLNWYVTPITEALKLTAKQREKLEEIGIKAVGQFEFLRAGRDPLYPDGLRSVKGFGAATVDAFENDIVEWLAANAREAEGDE